MSVAVFQVARRDCHIAASGPKLQNQAVMQHRLLKLATHRIEEDRNSACASSLYILAGPHNSNRQEFQETASVGFEAPGH